MAYIDTADYKGKQWCVYELKDRYGNYLEDSRFAMRKESQNHEFFCMDCGEMLILCAGNIREPYFRHHDDSDCISTKLGIGKYDLAPRRLIYSMAKESFPGVDFAVNKLLTEGIRPLIYADNGNDKLAIEYISHVSRYDTWEKTFDYYKKNKIPVIYILNARRFADAFTHYGYMFSRNLHVWGVINSDTSNLCLRHMYVDKIGRHLIQKDYCTDELKFLINGTFNCDFDIYCCNQITNLKEEEKQRKLKDEKRKRDLIARLEQRAEEARNARAMKLGFELENISVHEHKEIYKSRNNNYANEQAREQKKQHLINELSYRFSDKSERDRIASSTEQTRYNGMRVILCKRCGQVKPESEFLEYGGIGSVNLGTCYDCKK
jgi:competence CoiA-like predicted nuclease